MLYIRSPKLIYLITESLYPLTNIFPFPPCLQSLETIIPFSKTNHEEWTYHILSFLVCQTLPRVQPSSVFCHTNMGSLHPWSLTHPSPLHNLGPPLLIKWLSVQTWLFWPSLPRGFVLLSTKKWLVPLLPIASSRLFSSSKTPPPWRLEPLGCSSSSLPGALFLLILAILQSWLRVSFDPDLAQSNMTPLFKRMTLLPLDLSAILAHGHTLGAAITPNSSTFKADFPFSNLILIPFREHPSDRSFWHLTTSPSQGSVSSTSSIAFIQPNLSPKYLS